MVVLRKGDLTQEEVTAATAAEEQEEEGPPADGKIRFKKPTKRTSEEGKGDHNGEPLKKVKKKEVKKSMLSFDEDEEEED